MQNGLIVRVFIASPGDVYEERKMACDAILRWNAAHSFQRGVIIEPVLTETHSQLGTGEHPQDLIDNDLLDRCDLMIAVFWARLGTRTPRAASGTVQEIQSFIARKGAKNVILFFREDNIPQESANDFAALHAFKEDMKGKSLFRSYKLPQNFAAELRQQLDIVMNGILEERSCTPTPSTELGEDARILLAEAVLDASGRIVAYRDRAGMHIETNEKSFGELKNPKDEAKWLEAISELDKLGYIQATDNTREVYRVKSKAYTELKRTQPAEEATLSTFEEDYLRDLSRPRNQSGVSASYIDGQTGREAARYQDAIRRFRHVNLLSYVDGDYRLTSRGWQLADALWELAILDALPGDRQFTNEKAVAEAVGLTDVEEDQELHRLLHQMREKNLLAFKPTSHGKIISINPSGLTLRRHRTIGGL